MEHLDSKIARVLSKLDKQALEERSSKNDLSKEEMMLSITHDTGLFLNILLIANKAKRILEVGTSAGYSTLWFADAVIYNYGRNNGNKAITTIESNPDKVTRARRNFIEAGVDDMIEIVEGNALDILKTPSSFHDVMDFSQKKEEFDFIFFDADKENLIKYFDLVIPFVRIGGILAADNALFPIEYRAAMKKYLAHIKKAKNISSVTMPIGNGEELSIKLG